MMVPESMFSRRPESTDFNDFNFGNADPDINGGDDFNGYVVGLKEIAASQRSSRKAER